MKIKPLTETTIEEVHRTCCADYLRLLATQVETGKVAAFDLAWDRSVKKPAGKMACNTDIMTSDAEHDLDTRIEEHRAIAAKKIDVIDATEDLKDAEVEVVEDDPTLS